MSNATVTSRASRRRAVIEDVEWMLNTHRGLHEVATRIGLSERSLARELHRWERHDLARSFEAVAR